MIENAVNSQGQLRVRTTAPAGSDYHEGIRVGTVAAGMFVYGSVGGTPVYWVHGVPLTAAGQICFSTGPATKFVQPCIPISAAEQVVEVAAGTPIYFNFGQGFLGNGTVCIEVV